MARTLDEGKVKRRLKRKADARPCGSLQAMRRTLQFYSRITGNHWKVLRMGLLYLLYASKGLLGNYEENRSGKGEGKTRQE